MQFYSIQLVIILFNFPATVEKCANIIGKNQQYFMQTIKHLVRHFDGVDRMEH